MKTQTKTEMLLPEQWLAAVERAQIPAAPKHVAMVLFALSLDHGAPLMWTAIGPRFLRAAAATDAYTRVQAFRALSDLRAAGWCHVVSEPAPRGGIEKIELRMPRHARRARPCERA